MESIVKTEEVEVPGNVKPEPGDVELKPEVVVAAARRARRDPTRTTRYCAELVLAGINAAMTKTRFARQARRDVGSRGRVMLHVLFVASGELGVSGTRSGRLDARRVRATLRLAVRTPDGGVKYVRIAGPSHAHLPANVADVEVLLLNMARTLENRRFFPKSRRGR